MATIEERLKKIIKDQFGIEDDEFVPRARLYESFRADTVDLVEISWAIAEEFHLKFIDVDISRLLTIGDLLDFLKEHLLRRVRICYELLDLPRIWRVGEEKYAKLLAGGLYGQISMRFFHQYHSFHSPRGSKGSISFFIIEVSPQLVIRGDTSIDT